LIKGATEAGAEDRAVLPEAKEAGAYLFQIRIDLYADQTSGGFNPARSSLHTAVRCRPVTKTAAHTALAAEAELWSLVRRHSVTQPGRNGAGMI
jgi:hypothetical protein